MKNWNWKSGVLGMLVGALLLAGAPVVADVGDAILQGQGNVVDARTTLRGDAAGVNLRIVNGAADQPALGLFTEEGTPPLKVNRRAKVVNLNADLLDGKHRGYFSPAVAQPQQTVVGTFAAAGDRMIDSMTFDPPLPADVPQANVHYLADGAAFTAECGAAFTAAPGHLCIYAGWDNNASYSNIGRIENSSLGAGASKYGFVILWNVTGSSPNVRGNWAYTVPDAAPDVVTEVVPDLANATITDDGLIAGS